MPHTLKPFLSPELDQECERRPLQHPSPGIGPPLYRCGTAHRCNSAGDAVLSPMTFPPCPPVAPLIRWSLPRMYHRNGRQMTTHTGSAIQDLLLGSDSGMSQCGSYDDVTNVTSPRYKKSFSRYKRCDMSATDRPRPCPTPAMKRHHADLTNVASYLNPMRHWWEEARRCVYTVGASC